MGPQLQEYLPGWSPAQSDLSVKNFSVPGDVDDLLSLPFSKEPGVEYQRLTKSASEGSMCAHTDDTSVCGSSACDELLVCTDGVPLCGAPICEEIQPSGKVDELDEVIPVCGRKLSNNKSACGAPTCNQIPLSRAVDEVDEVIEVCGRKSSNIASACGTPTRDEVPPSQKVDKVEEAMVCGQKSSIGRSNCPRNSSRALSDLLQQTTPIRRCLGARPSTPEGRTSRPSTPMPSMRRQSTHIPSTPPPSTHRPNTPPTNTPRSSALRSSTPRASTPSTPRASTPRESTSRASTPRASTPRASTPRASTPRASAPRSSASRSGAPKQQCSTSQQIAHKLATQPSCTSSQLLEVTEVNHPVQSGAYSNFEVNFRQPLSEPLRQIVPMRRGTPARPASPGSNAPKLSVRSTPPPARAQGINSSSDQSSPLSCVSRACTPTRTQATVELARSASQDGDRNESTKADELLSRSNRRIATPSRLSSRYHGTHLPASATKGISTDELVAMEMKEKRRMLQRQREENGRRMIASLNGMSVR